MNYWKYKSVEEYKKTDTAAEAVDYVGQLIDFINNYHHFNELALITALAFVSQVVTDGFTKDMPDEKKALAQKAVELLLLDLTRNSITAVNKIPVEKEPTDEPR